jgi:hypothetical protein
MIGVSDHDDWAVLGTVARDGTLLDRHRVELLGEGLPKLPQHGEGHGLPVDQAVELVDRVRGSEERHAVLALDAVTMALPCRLLPQLVSSLFTFMYFRSSTRRGFPLQFDLIVLNGGADEIS